MKIDDFYTGVLVIAAQFVKHHKSTVPGHDFREEDLWGQFDEFVRGRGLQQAIESDDIPF